MGTGYFYCTKKPAAYRNIRKMGQPHSVLFEKRCLSPYSSDQSEEAASHLTPKNDKKRQGTFKRVSVFFLFPIELLLDCKNNMNYIQVSIKQGPLKSDSKLYAP